MFEERSKYFKTDIPKVGNWICLEFLNHTVKPTHYQIMSAPFNSGFNHPKNWAIEGSNDNSKWTKLDEKSNCELLNSRCVSSVFKIENTECGDFRYIRLSTTGRDCHNEYHLCFTSFDLYGYLI